MLDNLNNAFHSHNSFSLADDFSSSLLSQNGLFASKYSTPVQDARSVINDTYQTVKNNSDDYAMVLGAYNRATAADKTLQEENALTDDKNTKFNFIEKTYKGLRSEFEKLSSSYHHPQGRK
jgi:hypothetical protein